jgi:predicted MFS family arabinose efflux permease
MARLDVKATVSAPEEINIPLVRADYADEANTYRVCFEVALTLGSALLGVNLSIEHPDTLHWVAFVVLALAAGAFLFLARKKARKARAG